MNETITILAKNYTLANDTGYFCRNNTDMFYSVFQCHTIGALPYPKEGYPFFIENMIYIIYFISIIFFITFFKTIQKYK